jgi:putative FmdB family regulatory protein
MPTYEYRCSACGHQFELFQSITEGAKKKCPDCKQPKLERLIGSGAGILFRGSGFYQTDYRSEAYKQAAKAETESAQPAAKPESKPAEKPAAPAKDKGKAKPKGKAE